MPEYGHHLQANGAAAALTYAIGDIHGSLQKLQKLIVDCEHHAQGRPLQFVFLGDYLDRGPDSAGVIDYIVALQARLRDQVIALKGNHEDVALGVIDGTAPAGYWEILGGRATLRSYGVDSAQALPAGHVDWLRSLRLSHDDGRRFFVHAGIDPQRPLDAQREHDLLWIREPFLSEERSYARLIVHGHTPVETGAPDLRRNRCNLDTGAVFGGPLTAAVFAGGDTKPMTFLQAR